MRKIFAFAATAAMVLSISAASFAKTFVDVPSGHWAEDAVQKLSDKGILEGYPDGAFKGERQLTRYEYAMVVDRLMDYIEKTYCKKDTCKVGGDNSPVKAEVSKADLEEIKDIVKKLAAEFKDELAALQVKVDENSAKIKSLEDEVKTSRIGNVAVSGSVRQRVDLPSTDFPIGGATFYTNYYQPLYDKGSKLTAGQVAGIATLEAGYEMVPALNVSGKAGDNVTFAVGMDNSIRTTSTSYLATTGAADLIIDHAYVDVDFSPTVRELDKLAVRSGYQQFAFGPYGILVDNAGVRSNAAVKVDVAKDIVSFTGIGAMAGTTMPSLSGFGSSAKDAYAAGRMGLALSFADLGVNFLADGVGEEKGWGADVVMPLLKKSSFLTGLKAEYMTVTDLESGATPAAGAKDDSFIVGLDVYKSKRAGLTLSYADLPAAVSYSSLDANPFTEYDSQCAAGLEVQSTNCFSNEASGNLFPAGFEGLGVQASYIVFNNVTLAGKAFVGNFAGTEAGTIATDGAHYPGFGAVSVTKPINNKSAFRVEYAQQGRDLVSMNRLRGELLINF